jgi:hypothetical protein
MSRRLQTDGGGARSGIAAADGHFLDLRQDNLVERTWGKLASGFVNR